MGSHCLAAAAWEKGRGGASVLCTTSTLYGQTYRTRVRVTVRLGVSYDARAIRPTVRKDLRDLRPLKALPKDSSLW